MNRRKSKKVLIGLGSTVAFGSVGLIAGVGIKSIVEANVFNDSQFNLAQVKSVEEIPKFNVAERDLFPIDTSKFAREVHFGNTWRGQTLTPWGWLGVGSGGTNKRMIFLTGWNGEILWVNNDFPTNIGNRTDYDVYDMKYDWNSDLLFVIRTGNSNGLWSGSSSKIIIDVIQGSTGQTKYKSVLNNNSKLDEFIKNARSFIESTFESRNVNDHLFMLDVISSNNDSKTVYLTYSPNFMQLIEKSPPGDSGIRQIVSLKTILENWSKFQLTIKLDLGSGSFSILDQSNIWGGDKKPDNSTQDILWKNGGGNWEYKYYEDGKNPKGWLASEASLITNPFNTISADGHLIIHFLFADNKGNTYHLYYADRNTGSGDWNKYVGSERLAKVGDPDKTDVKDVGMPVLNKDDNEGKFYWSNIIRWESKVVSSANTRINRNMFEPNSVTFVYPYAASHSAATAVLPAFNVATITIDYKTGKIKTDGFAKPFLKSVVYQFGRQNFEYWIKNKSKYPSNGVSGSCSAGSTQEPYPWPDDANDPNWLIKFNRLISVSPFDNTIIIGSTSPFRAENEIKFK